MDQLFFGRIGAAPTPDAVLGGVSLVIWTITVIVAIKYAILVLRAQNDGEGGLFALVETSSLSMGKSLSVSPSYGSSR
jgi:KUP system potassium uptake protein